MTARAHELKTWPTSFEAILDGRKRYEIRPDDRNFAVGDELVLREWRPAHEDRCNFERRVVLPGIIVQGQDGTCERCKRRPGESLPGEYTAREIRARVTYLTPAGAFGLPKGLTVLGIAPPEIRAQPARALVSLLRGLTTGGHVTSCLSLDADGGPCTCGQTELLRALDHAEAIVAGAPWLVGG